MSIKKRFTFASLFAIVMALAVAGSAFAHYCTPTQKLPGAGSVGVFNIVTGEFTPGKVKLADRNGDGLPDNGGFISFTDGENFYFDVFMHTVLPDGALASGPDGDNMCDGMGIDNALVCLGIFE